MERTEAPTEGKLEALRDAGIVPYSLASVACLNALVLIFVFHAQFDLWKSFLAHVGQQLSRGGALTEAETRRMLEQCAKLLFVPAAATVCASLAWGLLQTKFLLRFSLISFRVARINPFHMPEVGQSVKRTLSGLVHVISALVCGLVVARLLVPDVALPLNRDVRYLSQWSAALTSRVFPYFIGVLALGVLATWLIGRMLFLVNHRMTREEVLHDTSSDSGEV